MNKNIFLQTGALSLVSLIALSPIMTISAHAGVFGVSPMLFEIELSDRPPTQALQVFNFSNEAMEFKVSVATWDLDENSRVLILEPTEQSLDQWILINPLQLKIAPKGKATVRFSVRPRIVPTPGEHRAMIYLTEIGSHDFGNIQVQGQFGVAVYGYVGAVRRKGQLHGVTVDTQTNPVTAQFDISSLGTAHIRLKSQFAIWSAAAFPGVEKTESIPGLGKADTVYPEGVLEVGELPTTPILPGTRRTLTLKTGRELPPGDYMLDINGELNGEILNMAIPFTAVTAEKEETAKGETPDK